MEYQSLKDKTVNGISWNFTGNALSYFITFVFGLFLARLLTPDDFGLAGVAILIVSVFSALAESGFSSALIRKSDVSQCDYNTAFYTNIFLSVLLYIVLFFGAPTISVFFSRQELIQIIRVSGLSIILSALSYTPLSIIFKEMSFKTKSKVFVISALSSGLIGVWIAYRGGGVWALVGQILSKQIATLICLRLYVNWSPSVLFSMNSLRYLWGFGWKLSICSFLDMLTDQVVKSVVGKIYSPSVLGQFSRSEQFSSLFSISLPSVVKQVTYPAVSEIQEDKSRMRGAYRKVIKMTTFVTTICLFSIGAIAEPLVYCLIGPQWSETARYLPIVCIIGSFYPLINLNCNMLEIIRRSDLVLKVTLFNKILYIPVIFVGIFCSFDLMLVVWIFASIISFLVDAKWIGKVTGYGLFMQFKDVAPSFGIASVVAVSMYFLKFLAISMWLMLPLQLVIGVSVYVVYCKIFNIAEYDDFKTLLMERLKIESCLRD